MSRLSRTFNSGGRDTRSKLLKLALLICGILLGAGAAELILRWRGVLYDVVAPHPDPRLNYTLKPGLRGRIGHVQHSYNSRGLRDHEYADDPAEGTVRILCIGDSITYAQSTPLESTFVKRLESSLNSRGESTFEVLNGGVSGYNACQEEAFLRNVGAAYHPRVVIWHYCLNDVDDPWYPYGPAGEGFTPIPQSWKRTLRERTVLWHFLRVQLYGAMHLLGLMPNDSSGEGYARRIFSLYGDGERARGDRAWGCILNAREQIRGSGGEMLLVAFPFAMQVTGRPDFPDLPQRDMAARCREAGIPFLDLLPVFTRETGPTLFAESDFTHLSDKGHEVSARAIEDELTRLGIISLVAPRHAPPAGRPAPADTSFTTLLTLTAVPAPLVGIESPSSFGAHGSVQEALSAMPPHRE